MLGTAVNRIIGDFLERTWSFGTMPNESSDEWRSCRWSRRTTTRNPSRIRQLQAEKGAGKMRIHQLWTFNEAAAVAVAQSNIHVELPAKSTCIRGDRSTSPELNYLLKSIYQPFDWWTIVSASLRLHFPLTNLLQRTETELKQSTNAWVMRRCRQSQSDWGQDDVDHVDVGFWRRRWRRRVLHFGAAFPILNSRSEDFKFFLNDSHWWVLSRRFQASLNVHKLNWTRWKHWETLWDASWERQLLAGCTRKRTAPPNGQQRPWISLIIPRN